jgi:hypothetical protein
MPDARNFGNGLVPVDHAGEAVAPDPSEDAEALLLDLEVWLQGSIDIATRLQQIDPSRGRALAIARTKLEEAQMWLERGERR